MQVKELFNHKANQFNKWLKIQTSFAKYFSFKNPNKYGFIFKQDFVDKNFENSYELISAINSNEEFSSFKKAMFSKSALFRYSEFRNGLTEIDYLSISNSLFLKEFHDTFFPLFYSLISKLKELAIKYKTFVQIGRTHGVHAEPTSFGHKFAILYSDLSRYSDILWMSRKDVEVVSIDLSNVYIRDYAFDLQRFMADDLELFGSCSFEKIFTSSYINYLGTLNSIIQLINKFALDLKLLSFEETKEVSFDEKYGDIFLLAKSVDSSYEAFLSLQSSSNFLELPFFKSMNSCITDISKNVFLSVQNLVGILERLEVNKDSLSKNLELMDKSVYSQIVMLYLLKLGSFSRLEVSEDIKKAFSESKSTGFSFEELLASNPKYQPYLSENVFKNLFRPGNFLKNIDDIYERIFKEDDKTKVFKQTLWTNGEIQYRLDLLAEKLNYAYFSEREPIAVISFAERSLMFLSHIISRLNFEITINTFGNLQEDLAIEKICLDKKLVQSRRVLIFDFYISNESNLEHFIEKLKSSIHVKDVKVCCFLKSETFFSEHFSVDWYGLECYPDDFYVGFGKNGGVEQPFRHISSIGTLL